MTRQLLKKTVLLFSIFGGFLLSSLVIAQDDQEERLNGLFVQDEDDAEREARRAEFEKNNPEAAARMKQRRAEMEANRAEFEAKYPEAAAEMKAWREEGKTEGEQHRAEMESRRAEFQSKYPEAAAEMKAMRQADQVKREQRKTEMQARRKQFEEKYPDAAAEMRNRREGMRRMRPSGGDFERRSMNRRGQRGARGE